MAEACRTTWYRVCGGDGEAAADEERESRPQSAAGTGEAREGSVSYEAPISGIEKKLAGMWSEVLGIDRVGVNDNFFILAGIHLK
ncbi:hypothetical protein P7H16_12965 [Paenibacillus larvae]|nr:hypothetical protein [Paenibacillus larvae]MDT2247643.1 hypothetical protein [Paenibacillus larvae]